VVDEIFQSYAQNGEDIILWRALGDVPNGRYVDVGANDPSYLSVSKAFYDHGWRGIAVEPSRYYADRLRDQRPGDIVVEVAVASHSGETVTLHEIADSGLSTLVDEIRDEHASKGWAVRDVEVRTKRLDEILADANWNGLDIHFIMIDVEGSEGDVLASIDLQRWRPWILVVESTAPNSTNETHATWEPDLLNAGYQFCLFDGLSRYYVADEQADKLGHQLSYGPCVFDSYQTHLDRDTAVALQAANDTAERWRAEAAESGARAQEIADLRATIAAMRQTLSWRVTAPLRAVRKVASRH
jgi:FkbM family methyltransferase